LGVGGTMNAVKLMPDYECHVLWHHDSEEVGEIDPSSLGLSQGLVVALELWAREYDSTLNKQVPTNSGFPTQEIEEKFIASGYELAARLKEELKIVEVVYFDIGLNVEEKI
jgi:hypothetical protein